MRRSGLSPSVVLITGATGAIGGALAQSYAAPGRILILQGRRQDRLDELAVQCEAQGARVQTKALDLRDRAALADWVAGCCAQAPPDLVFANAGLNSHAEPGEPLEPWSSIEALIDVNVLAVMALVQGVVPTMRRRGQGQIVLISSLAGWYGLPVTPTYSASKAAIRVYGEALRGSLAPSGIQVSVVLPGYVSSDMCDAMPGPKPFLWSPERAVRAIRRGIERDRARISFPFPLNLGTWFLAVLPASVSGWIVRQLGYQGGHA